MYRRLLLLWRELNVVERHRVAFACGITLNSDELETGVSCRCYGHVSKIELSESVRSRISVLERADTLAIHSQLPNASVREFLNSHFNIVSSRLGNVQFIRDVISNFTGIEKKSHSLGESPIRK